MDDKLYLGKVIYCDKNWARLDALAVEVDGRWKLIENRATVFPPEGRAFSTRRLPNATKDSFWTFNRRDNVRSEDGKDIFLVEEAAVATPIIDLSMLSLEEARLRLFNQGIAISGGIGRVYAVVLLSGHLFCELELSSAGGGKWKAEPVTSPLPLMPAPEAWREVVTIDGLKFVPAQELPSDYPVKHVNWCADQDFVERVLERFRKFSLNLKDTKYARPAKEHVQYIARALEQAGLLPGNEDDAELNFERLRSDWPVLEARFAASEKLCTLVVESKAAQDAINAAVAAAEERAVDAIRPEVERRLKHEIEQSLAESIGQRDVLRRDVEALTLKRETLQQQVAEVEELCKKARIESDVLANHFRTVVRDLRIAFEGVSPHELPFARVAVARVEHALNQGGYEGVALLPSVVAPWARTAEVSVEQSIDFHMLHARMEEEAKLHAVDTGDLCLIDALSRAGELVLINGPQSEFALTAYARCVTGSVVRSMALDPSVIGLEDLWRSPGTHHPTAMAYAWNAAEAEPSRFQILCLRNFDAAPFQLWLASLNAVLSSVSRPRNLLIFATTTSVYRTGTLAEGLRDSLTRWLVPIYPSVHVDGPLTVLSSIVGTVASPTRLSANASAKKDLTLDWLRLMDSLKVDPHIVRRVAHLASALLEFSNSETQSKLSPWCEFLSSSELKGLPSSLRDGYSALDHLTYQQ